MNIMKILLFGGSGWLGHNIALKLAEEHGGDLTIVTRGRKQTFQNEISGIRTITADKSDEESMRKIFETPYTHVIDTVPSEASIRHIRKYAKHLLHYVHCSSTGGYAPLPFIPCNETALYRGFIGNSGWDQKRIVDELVMNLFRTTGFPATVIRPCYITGPGMLPLDNLGGRRADFIPDIRAERTLDLPGDGETLLQPVHVRDLAESFRLSLLHPDAAIGQIYNICLSHALTLNRYLELTASVFGKKPVIHYMTVDDMLRKYEGKVHEIGLRFFACHMCFSIEKAVRDLGYRPSCSPEDAVMETALWAASQTPA